MFYIIAPSLSVLRIGSMEVGALLNDAYKEYEVTIKYIVTCSRILLDMIIIPCAFVRGIV